MKLRRRLISFASLFTFCMFLVNERQVYANHSKAINISAQTYPIFLYIVVGLFIILIYVVYKIITIRRELKRTSDQVTTEKLKHQKMFYFISMIMLIIGILSLILIYVFLRFMAQGH